MQLNKEILAEITRVIHSKSFHKSALYRVLRDELTAADHWKAKRRGVPGYNKGANINCFKVGDLVMLERSKPQEWAKY